MSTFKVPIIGTYTLQTISRDQLEAISTLTEFWYMFIGGKWTPHDRNTQTSPHPSTRAHLTPPPSIGTTIMYGPERSRAVDFLNLYIHDRKFPQTHIYL